MRIFVATPTRDSRVEIEFVQSILNEQLMAVVSGDDFQVAFQRGTGSPTSGRNQLVQMFLESGFDRLMFIDADISWQPGDMLKVAHHPADVVGGAYRYKLDEEMYPVLWPEAGNLQADENGLLDVVGLPTGFLAISRSVFERFKEAYPERTYLHMGNPGHAYFHAPWMKGHLYSEDTAFCHDWREIGGKVMLDPELTLTHHDGPKAYTGHVGNWLRKRNGLA